LSGGHFILEEGKCEKRGWSIAIWEDRVLFVRRTVGGAAGNGKRGNS